MTTETLALVIAAASVLGFVGLAVVIIVTRSSAGPVDPPMSAPEMARRLEAVQSALANRDGAFASQVDQLDTKLAMLQQAVTGREAALDEQVRGIGSQMQSITSLFTNDRARGGWAEIGMRRIFEQGGLVEGRDFTCQVNGGDVHPDAVVYLPGGRNIVIDAKFPVARFVEALTEEDPDRRRRLLGEQGRELERVGKSLTAKGYAELASGGYVVMYLPSQAVYEAAASAHPELLDRLMTARVIIAGPSTLYALLLNVASLLTEFKALQQADQILDDARELHKRMATFAGHLQGVGVGLTGAVRAFNGAVGSWGSRVAPQLTRMSDQTGRAEIDAPAVVEEAVREVPEPALRVVG
ncbi:MAG TPA: DNA recombination protein RmuC [Acidimicrobiia bacterium]|nr:DNA recombination protein RmuC [Acidimicrobiia bacterium]